MNFVGGTGVRWNPASHKGQEGQPLPLTLTEGEAFCLKEEGQARLPPMTVNNGDGGGGVDKMRGELEENLGEGRKGPCLF